MLEIFKNNILGQTWKEKRTYLNLSSKTFRWIKIFWHSYMSSYKDFKTSCFMNSWNRQNKAYCYIILLPSIVDEEQMRHSYLLLRNTRELSHLKENKLSTKFYCREGKFSILWQTEEMVNDLEMVKWVIKVFNMHKIRMYINLPKLCK